MFLFEKIAKKIKLWVQTPDTPQEIIDYANRLRNTLSGSYTGNELIAKFHKKMRKYEKEYRKKLSQAEIKANEVRLPGGLIIDKRDYGNLGVDNMSPVTQNLAELQNKVFNNPKTFMESYHNTMQIANAYKRPTSNTNLADYAIPAAGIGIGGVGLYSALKSGSRMPMPMPMYQPAPVYGYSNPIQYEQDYYH